MEGFFKKEDIEDKQSDCLKCKLFKSCVAPKQKPRGKGEKKILLVSEAAGASLGNVLLKAILKNNGIDLERDCWRTEAVICKPKGRAPTKREIKCCNPILMKTIKKKKPHLIILLGAIALDSFISTRFKEASGGINKWRGFVIPDQKQLTWIAPMFSPKYVVINEEDKIIKKIFREDIKNALQKLDKKVVKEIYDIQIINEFSAISLLQTILKYPPELLAFDYETTGIKPYRKEHEIICVSICFDKEQSHVFLLTDAVKKEWKKILKNKNIKKTAHNIKFEHLWSTNILKVNTKGWLWDSMQAAHILDNRKNINSLKFQAYVNFGQADYNSHLDQYLKSKGEFNNIKEAPIKELMEYCGMDAILQHKLTLKQMEEFKCGMQMEKKH